MKIKEIKSKTYLFLLGIAFGIVFIFSGVWLYLAIPTILLFILWAHKRNAGINK